MGYSSGRAAPMPDTFSRTSHSLDADSGWRLSWAVLVAFLLVAGWATWFSCAELTVYETSASARVEVMRATHPFDAPIPGRVAKVHFALDDEVDEGTLLVELDAEPQRLALGEAKAKAASMGPQLAATKAELEAEKRAQATFRDQGESILGESASRTKEAEVATLLAREELKRIDRLADGGAVPEIDVLRSKADAERKAAAEAALHAQQEKLEREWITGKSDRQIRVVGLQRDIVRIETELAQVRAQIASLEHEIERRRIRAPASGRIGEVSNVRPGAFVDEGDHLGTIVGRGDLRMIAAFVPEAAFGRIRTGQMARVRFDGFPWTEFGETRTSVAEVAREVRDGQVRVELTIVTPNERIPLQHGLTGSVEVEVERSTPARLVLRAVGTLLHHRKTEAPSRPVDDRREPITRQ
ncbi:HlyD family secretion protein [Pendulispora rubella]|uniref:HlyD family secretion protein n=1 Tax=Pendulispora rubella TaxID=2741070 RepID=UPI00374E154E